MQRARKGEREGQTSGIRWIICIICDRSPRAIKSPHFGCEKIKICHTLLPFFPLLSLMPSPRHSLHVHTASRSISTIVPQVVICDPHSRPHADLWLRRRTEIDGNIGVALPLLRP